MLIKEADRTASIAQPAPCRKHGFYRRARGTLLIALAGFIVIQAGLRVTIDRWVPEMRDPTFEIKYRRLTGLIRKHAEPPAVVLFLGSSLTANGVKAGVVEAPLAEAIRRPVVSYNLATYGAGPYTQLLYMQRMLRRGTRPDLVVLEMSPMGYDVHQSSFDILRSPAHLLEYRDLDTGERHSVQPKLRKEWWEAHVVPAYGHRMMILNWAARLLVPFKDHVEIWEDTDEHGWYGRPAPSPEEHRMALQDVEERYKDRLQKYKMDEAPVKALRELLALLAKERIATVLVTMPVVPPISTFYTPGSTTPLMTKVREMTDRYGVVWIDASNWFGGEQFRDSYHLHEHGAQAFTERLVQEILAPPCWDTLLAPRPASPAHDRLPLPALSRNFRDSRQ